jgi:signal recognition particle-docking protein FtsY
MFGILRDKLSKAIKSISEKFKAKEEEKEEPKPERLEELEQIKKEVEKKEIKGVLITYFVHGTTKENEKGIATGWVQGELSKLGLKQAKELGEAVDSKKFDIVFCSDLKRAVDSANLAFKNKYKIVQDKRLREANYGDFTRKPSKEFDIIDYIDKPFPNGESYGDVEKRIAEFLNHLFDNYYGKHIAIVAHQAPQLALEVLLNGKTWERAIKEDWRAQNNWQPGWDYELKEKIELVGEKPRIEQPKIEKPHEIEKKEAPKLKLEKKSFISKIFEKAVKTVTERKLEEKDLMPVLSELETDLIEADVAIEVAERIKADLLKELAGKEIKRGRENDEIVTAFKHSLLGILDVPQIDLEEIIKKAKSEDRPAVLLVFGMNGTGKSLNLSKVAYLLKRRGHRPILSAGDTYRAAGDIQLEMYANSISVPVIKHKSGADSCAVLFDTISAAKARGYDVVLGDTAGRMHTDKNLLNELAKIVRVNKPDLKILVLDSLTGSDVLYQFGFFDKAVNGIDAVVFSKVDVNEKGGNILSICHSFRKPILFLGVGQGMEDLELFDPEKFTSLLVGM